MYDQQKALCPDPEIAQAVYRISEDNIHSKDAEQLLRELSDVLQNITGDSGRNSFDIEDMNDPRALFVIARNRMGEAVGCGAIRQMNQNVAEVKRMYAKFQAKGIGTEILSYLEEHAGILGFLAIRLETRIINEGAVAFYEKRGYKRIENYGKYYNNDKAICFQKHL
jgi:ribosomal protein S18 acetylase RimI-like enzyme